MIFFRSIKIYFRDGLTKSKLFQVTPNSCGGYSGAGTTYFQSPDKFQDECAYKVNVRRNVCQIRYTAIYTVRLRRHAVLYKRCFCRFPHLESISNGFRSANRPSLTMNRRTLVNATSSLCLRTTTRNWICPFYAARIPVNTVSVGIKIFK